MTKLEAFTVLQVLHKIKNPDGKVAHAIAICTKQITYYDSLKGQMKENYDYGDSPF